MDPDAKNHAGKRMMTTSSHTEKPLTVRFINAGSEIQLELMNTTDQPLKCIEVLTVFLKDEETPGGGPSRVNIKFKEIEYLHPRERAVLSHKTWIDGKPVDPGHDQLERLQVVAGEVKPYVLDISWQDTE